MVDLLEKGSTMSKPLNIGLIGYGYIGAYAEVDDQIVDTMLITQARDQ